ncbi:MAG: hypothetical protein KA354_03585 [Phycisphaerae bacterium]|nr:hypothetical protein [Phycisphaerae bacterium]
MRFEHHTCTLVVLTGILGLSLPAPGADWTRDFNDGTLQDLDVFDYAAYLVGLTGFTPLNVDNAARVKFVTGDINPFDGTPIEDIGGLYDPDDIFADTDAKVLIKWSNNPLYATLNATNTKGMTLGMGVRLNMLQFKGYLVGPTNTGVLAMTKLIPVDFQDFCQAPDVGEVTIPNHDVTKNWWLRAQAFDVAGGVRVRARTWMEGTTEPEEWQIQCTDREDPYPSGGVGLVAQEDGPTTNSNDMSWVDLDDFSARTMPEMQCYNNIDDDGNGLTDCADPNCAGTPACSCRDPFADLDGDSDVDQVDFGLWQLCFSGPAGIPFDPDACACLDRDDSNADHLFNPPDDGDGDVDMDDFAKFAACYSGPGIPADKACDNVN